VHEDSVLGVIPARLQSQRLPRKPLLQLAGRTLIEWVWRRVSSFPILDACVIATDSPEVVAECERFGARVELTASTHASGTERVAELVARPAHAGAGVIVNVQGDEPFVSEAQVAGAVAQVRAGCAVGTVATPVRTLSAWRSPDVVKVVRRGDGVALYFTRAPVPHRRDAPWRSWAVAISATSAFMRMRRRVCAVGGVPPHALGLERLEQHGHWGPA
jgi:3-deoxy-manno-octulosonate cytidylyltransferase (CMP-KDO synthetase)